MSRVYNNWSVHVLSRAFVSLVLHDSYLLQELLLFAASVKLNLRCQSSLWNHVFTGEVCRSWINHLVTTLRLILEVHNDLNVPFHGFGGLSGSFFKVFLTHPYLVFLIHRLRILTWRMSSEISRAYRVLYLLWRRLGLLCTYLIGVRKFKTRHQLPELVNISWINLHLFHFLIHMVLQLNNRALLIKS